MVKTLYSFDFDDTMCHTVDDESGKQIWKDKFGTDWPHIGWWSKPETIDPEIYDTPVNPWVYEKYLEASADEDGACILATGRLQKVPKMRENIQKILMSHNLSFDEIYVINSSNPLKDGNGKDGIYLNWGGDTYIFKTTLFEKLIEITGCEKFVMYDDREAHLEKFEEWAKEQPCQVVIIDVVNKTTKIIN